MAGKRATAEMIRCKCMIAKWRAAETYLYKLLNFCCCYFLNLFCSCVVHLTKLRKWRWPTTTWWRDWKRWKQIATLSSLSSDKIRFRHFFLNSPVSPTQQILFLPTNTSHLWETEKKHLVATGSILHLVTKDKVWCTLHFAWNEENMVNCFLPLINPRVFFFLSWFYVLYFESFVYHGFHLG